MSALASLRAVPFLAALPEDELARLAQHAHARHYRAGATIFHRDDPGSTLHIIRRGRVKLVLPSAEGREVTVGLLGPGDFFGDLALLDSGPRSASVVTLEAVETLTLDRGPFLNVLATHPRASTALLAALGERLRRTDEFIQDVLFLDLPARLAKHLLALADEHGAPAAGGIKITVRLSQTELAGIVGSTRESVNRCLNAFADRGLLALERDAITILRPEEVRRRIY